MFARSDIYFRLHLLLIIIHITCISLSLRQTSAPIHLPSVLGVLVMRVNSTNVQYEGLMIGGVGRRMNSKVNQSNKVCIESKRRINLACFSICPLPSSPGPYI
jgi:hypothetical protein